MSTAVAEPKMSNKAARLAITALSARFSGPGVRKSSVAEKIHEEIKGRERLIIEIVFGLPKTCLKPEWIDCFPTGGHGYIGHSDRSRRTDRILMWAGSCLGLGILEMAAFGNSTYGRHIADAMRSKNNGDLAIFAALYDGLESMVRDGDFEKMFRETGRDDHTCYKIELAKDLEAAGFSLDSDGMVVSEPTSAEIESIAVGNIFSQIASWPDHARAIGVDSMLGKQQRFYGVDGAFERLWHLRSDPSRGHMLDPEFLIYRYFARKRESGHPECLSIITAEMILESGVDVGSLLGKTVRSRRMFERSLNVFGDKMDATSREAARRSFEPVFADETRMRRERMKEYRKKNA